MKYTAFVDFISESGGYNRLGFGVPTAILTTTKLANVTTVLAAAQAAAEAGKWAVGFVSYEAASAFESALTTHEPRDIPLIWFAIFDGLGEGEPEQDAERSVDADWVTDLAHDDYVADVGRVHEHIRRGETYQVNYTFRLKSALQGNLEGYYNSLLRAHRSDYSGYLNMGSHTIISNSPELFFSTDQECLTVIPMKGTIARGRHADEDLQMKYALQNSLKDRAENVMIVDLMRSDLSKVAKLGTVDAVSLFDLQPLPTVWQMTSTVRCKPKDGTTLVDIFRAMFPAGSVTGAPKAKTMQIIRDLETEPRGVYCGAFGVIRPGGSAVFNVAIRTVVVNNETGQAICGIGSGITIDSDAEAEYQEALLKSKFLTTRSDAFSLLETLLLEDGQYYLLTEHAERMMGSAEYFSFAVDKDLVLAELRTYGGAHANGRYKVRLTVDQDCGVSISGSELPDNKVETVEIARSPIDINTPFVFNKTTRRGHYDEFRKQFPHAFDIMLWNKCGFVTEFTMGNVVVELRGLKVTPPVSDGLLPGTFRRHLLQTGEIVEQQITLDDVKSASRIWLINSVRTWVEVKTAGHCGAAM